MPTTKSMPVDRNGRSVQAGSVIHVFTVALTDATYAPVTIPTGQACKSFVAKSRSGDAWYLGDAAAPAAYVTLDSPFACNCVGYTGSTLFYAKGSGADVLEVLLLN